MSRVEQQLLDLYFDRSKFSPVILVLVAALTVWLFRSHDPAFLYHWNGAVIGLSIVRATLAYGAPRPTPRWLLLPMRVATSLTGLIMAAGVWSIAVQCPPDAMMTMSLIGVGVVAAAVFTLEVDYPSYVIYATPLMLALCCAQVASFGWQAWPTSFLFLPFGTFMLGSTWARHKEHRERLQYLEKLGEQAEELRRTNTDLARAREEVCGALEARQQFLANMSHEIRTPLNGVLGMVELVLADERNPERRELLEMARGSARSLTELLGNILEFSRLEAERLEIESVPFDLLPLLESAVETVAQPAGAKGLHLGLDVDPSSCPRLCGDPVRIRQILVNLLGNAIKFTQDGEVVLRAQVLPGATGRARVIVQVEDTGVGIPVDKQELVFEPFRQADAGTSRRFGGSGLGLAISRLLARRMGGEVLLAERSTGTGTLFVLILDLQRAAEEPDVPSAPFAGRHFVVADLHPLCAAGLVRMLCGLGATVERHDAMASATAEGHVLLVDEDIVATVNASPDQHVLVIRRVGAGSEPDGHCPLRRPITAARLLLRCGSPAPAPPAELPEQPLLGYRVLVAEDTLVNQVLFRRLLTRWGADVVLAETGVEALQRADESTPDLVLMDISMPEMDGLEATGRLRARSSLAGLPILALTAHAFREDHERCLAAGCDAVITKPVAPDRMLATILAHLRGVPRPA